VSAEMHSDSRRCAKNVHEHPSPHADSRSHRGDTGRYRTHCRHLERCVPVIATAAHSCSAASVLRCMYAPIALRFETYAVKTDAQPRLRQTCSPCRHAGMGGSAHTEKDQLATTSRRRNELLADENRTRLFRLSTQAKPKRTEHWDGVRNYQARNFCATACRRRPGLLLIIRAAADPHRAL